MIEAKQSCENICDLIEQRDKYMQRIFADGACIGEICLYKACIKEIDTKIAILKCELESISAVKQIGKEANA